jgi:3-hydroxyisobutyrate dehydrogenase-like beta-hydroxyacid dehydrogenase
MRVAFIGLGKMGLPMAANLLRAGHEVTVYNRTVARGEPLRTAGARLATSPADAVQGVEVLVTMLADDAAVEAVLFGPEGAFAALPEGAVHASMTTISVRLARALAQRHDEAGHGFLAAPVFGRPEVAQAGKLQVVAAGPVTDLERCRPLFAAVGQGVVHVGEDPGLAPTVKLAGNFLLAAAIEALGESVALVEKSGGDKRQFLDIMGNLFRSPIYENYGRLVVERRFTPAGFALRHGLKDVRFALAAADAEGVPMPLASLLHDHFLTAANTGLADADWAALGGLAADRAGLPEARRR